MGIVQQEERNHIFYRIVALKKGRRGFVTKQKATPKRVKSGRRNKNAQKSPHATHQPTGILSLHRTVCKIAGYHKEKRHRPPGKHTHRATHIAGKRHMEQQHKQRRCPFEQVKCSVPQNTSSFICKYEETVLQCKTVIW